MKIKFLLLFIVVGCFSCTPDQKKYANKSALEKYSQNLLGKEKYSEIKKNLIDSIELIMNTYPEYLGNVHKKFIIQPILCFNKDTSKFITSLIGQGQKHSAISPILGFKYQNEWEFFKVKSSTHYFNERHDFDKSDTIPMSFLLDRCTPTGYLKQNMDTGEFEINQYYFDRQFRGAGWGEPHGGEPFPYSVLLEMYYKHVKFRRTEMAKQKIEKQNNFLDDK